MGPDGTVGKSEFARLRGVSPAMVSKWISLGMLVLTPDGKRVVAAESLARIAARSDPTRGGRGGHTQAPSQPASPSRGGRPPGSGGISFADVRTEREGYAARQAELDYLERIGSLVERKAFERAIVDALAPMLQALESLSARIGPAVAAEADVRKVENLIDGEIATIRREIAETLRRMAAGPPAREQ